MEGETKCRTMLQLCIIVSPPPWRWKHASHPDPNRGTPRTGFEWTNPALNGSSLAFSKVYSRSIFFWKQGATIEISQFDGGKRYKGGVEQWLNPLHSPWAQMKPSIEKFKLEMLFNTNLMPNLPTMYIYIYCKKNKYVCIYIIIFVCITCSIQASSLSSHPTWHLWTHCKVHFYKRHLFSSHCTLGCLKRWCDFAALVCWKMDHEWKCWIFLMEGNEHFSYCCLSFT